jgi:hypothetical protein
MHGDHISGTDLLQGDADAHGSFWPNDTDATVIDCRLEPGPRAMGDYRGLPPLYAVRCDPRLAATAAASLRDRAIATGTGGPPHATGCCSGGWRNPAASPPRRRCRPPRCPARSRPARPPVRRGDRARRRRSAIHRQAALPGSRRMGGVRPCSALSHPRATLRVIRLVMVKLRLVARLSGRRTPPRFSAH